MQFTQIVVVAVLAVVAHGQISANQLVSDINTMTDISTNTNNLAMSISESNAVDVGSVSSASPPLASRQTSGLLYSQEIDISFKAIIIVTGNDLARMGGGKGNVKTKRRDSSPLRQLSEDRQKA